MYRLLLGLISLMLITSPALSSTGVTQSYLSQSQIETSVLQPSVYEKLPQNQQTLLAQVWGITPKEYSRYLWLMNNTENGIYYAQQHLDPTWILAINAKDKEDRRHFTLQAIKNERLRLAKLLAFEQEFSRLQQELYPNDKPITLPGIKTLQQTQSAMLQSNDMLLLFTDIATTGTSALLNRLIGILKEHPNVKLNIYVTGQKVSDKAIQRWAAEQQIPHDWVKKGKITLNHDNGRFAQLTQNKVALPFVVLNRDGLFQAIDLHSLEGNV